jgi:hypothetical protein
MGVEKQGLEDLASSIEFFFDHSIVSDDNVIQDLSKHLSLGDVIVIRNAFHVAFAERMFDCLDQFSQWQLYEKYERHFHYHHHNIYDEKLFPDDLNRCKDIFASEATKKFIRRLSQRDCSGGTSFSASWYQPGDYSLPHTDLVYHKDEQREVAFVWNLTKTWQADWGGEFFWCKKGRSIAPTFNMLLLFNVDEHSKHFVTQVAAHAQAKRLAVSGWWYGKLDSKNKGLATAVSEENQRIEFI